MYYIRQAGKLSIFVGKPCENGSKQQGLSSGLRGLPGMNMQLQFAAAAAGGAAARGPANAKDSFFSSD